MDTNDLLDLLTQLFFLLLGLVTAINYIRYGGETRRDIALMAGSLSATFLVHIIEPFIGLPPLWIDVLGAVALMAQPFLLLRLAQYFHDIPLWIRRLALVGMVLTSGLLMFFYSYPKTIAGIVFLTAIAYFVLVNGYAMTIFVQGALAASGVVKRRLRFAAAGSGLLAFALFVVGVWAISPTWEEWLTPMLWLAAIGAAINFHVCFAPSRWLQRAWQYIEIHTYLQGVSRELINKRLNVSESLEELCKVAILATGGAAAGVVQQDKSTSRWILRYLSQRPELVNSDWSGEGILNQVHHQCTSGYIRTAQASTQEDIRLLVTLQAETMLVAPLIAAESDWGLLLVFLDRSSLFIEDDLSLVTLLAQQSAVYLENSALIQEMQSYSESLERKVKERTLEIRQMNKQLERRVAERTADLSRANAELGQVVRAKDEFLANMSHELRTPLNGILILAEILLEQIRGPINERQAKSLQTIQSSGHHLLSLINDILDLSKIEAGKLDLQLKSVAIEDICSTSLQFVKEQAHQKEIRLTFDSDVHQTKMEADPRRLKQILINLLSNAVKFTSEGGQVILQARVDPQENWVCFSVEDTGIGIAAEDMPHLFKPFSQLDSSLTREHEGSGLGLVLVSRLVELHGGSVQVVSEGVPGKGSCFTVSLPRQHLPVSFDNDEDRALLENLEQTLEQLSFQGKRTIKALVIEDSITATEQVERYLHELNIQMVAYSSSETDVETILASAPDFIILDLLMPERSGWEILAQLKADPRVELIPVIIISVVDEPVKGLAAGAVEYLVKPITRKQFRHALSRVVTRLTAVELQRSGRKEAGANGASIPEVHGPLILLAEDNETNIQAIGEYLQEINYQVMVARNGGEALELAIDQKPDLILMDIQMPVLDGLTVTQRLRAMSEFEATPIVALTALAMPGDRERCLAAGANEYLAKPVSLKKLTGIMNQLLAG
ncbi:MAG: response regulator [Anaerolineae bacterium]|nr:response regulator [Anaerolineae bacterium]